MTTGNLNLMTTCLARPQPITVTPHLRTPSSSRVKATLDSSIKINLKSFNK